MCTEQLIYIYALSKLRESAVISAVPYTNLNFFIVFNKVMLNLFLSNKSGNGCLN